MSQQLMNTLPSETHLFLKMLEIIFFFLKKILPSLAATKAIWPTVHCERWGQCGNNLHQVNTQFIASLASNRIEDTKGQEVAKAGCVVISIRY